MSRDIEEPSDGGGMTKIDEKYADRGYTSRSEAIRGAIRAWDDPPIRLSEELLADLAVSRTQRERGETRSLEEVAEKYRADIDEA